MLVIVEVVKKLFSLRNARSICLNACPCHPHKVQWYKGKSLVNQSSCVRIILVQISCLNPPPELLRKMKEASLDISTRKLELNGLHQCQLKIRHYCIRVELQAQILSLLFEVGGKAVVIISRFRRLEAVHEQKLLTNDETIDSEELCEDGRTHLACSIHTNSFQFAQSLEHVICSEIKVLSSVPSFPSRNPLPDGVFNQSQERSTSARVLGCTGSLIVYLLLRFTLSLSPYYTTTIQAPLPYLLLQLWYNDNLKDEEFGKLYRSHL